MTHTSKFIKNCWFHDFLLIFWKCQNNQENSKEIIMINCCCQWSSKWLNSLKIMIDFDGLVNVFDKLSMYWEIRRLSKKTMKLIQNQWFQNKIYFWGNHLIFEENISQNHWNIIHCLENDGKVYWEQSKRRFLILIWQKGNQNSCYDWFFLKLSLDWQIHWKWL